MQNMQLCSDCRAGSSEVKTIAVLWLFLKGYRHLFIYVHFCGWPVYYNFHRRQVPERQRMTPLKQLWSTSTVQMITRNAFYIMLFCPNFWSSSLNARIRFHSSGPFPNSVSHFKLPILCKVLALISSQIRCFHITYLNPK